MTGTVTPPGKARITPCPDCQGVAGKPCHECHGDGRLLRRACPLCGDLGWDYANGTDDRQGMTCRYHWAPGNPAWRAQVLPGITAAGGGCGRRREARGAIYNISPGYVSELPEGASLE